MELGPVLTLAGGLATALITAAVTFYATRSKAKTDLQASLSAGFGALADQLQEERKELQMIIKETTREIDSLREIISKKNELIEEYRIDQTYSNLYISQLEFIIKSSNLVLPNRQRRVTVIVTKKEDGQ